MKPNDANKFAAMMTALGELYGQAISESLSDIYWETLKAFTWDDVNLAVTQHVQNTESGCYMPKPADIMRYLTGSIETRALIAWSLVEESMRTIGCYESVTFDDLLINKIIRDMGGWVRLCQSKTAEMPFLAREFQKRYGGYLETPPQYCPTYLLGIIENEQQHGFALPMPVRISNTEKNRNLLPYQRQQPEIFLPNKADDKNIEQVEKNRVAAKDEAPLPAMPEKN